MEKRIALDNSSLPSKNIDLDGFIDINAGVDYKLTKDFLGLFISNKYS